jgi:hypothetical protein
MKRLLALFLLLAALRPAAQNIDGYWYGTASVAHAETANNYLVELIMKEQNNRVQAVVNYYFRNTFRSFKINGSFNSVTRQLNLFNLPLTYYGSSDRMAVDCAMDLNATLRVAKAGSNLKGRFVSKPEYRITCPEVVFDLQMNRDANNPDSILTALRQYKETYQVWSPGGYDTVVPVINYFVNERYKERENVVAQEIELDADSVQVSFYDNGEVDGDSISVFYNDRLLTFSRKLSAQAVQMRLGLDSTRAYNEISMFADNLGSIPPNTALMVVYDGKQRHEIRLTSNLQKNASVRFRRKIRKP